MYSTTSPPNSNGKKKLFQVDNEKVGGDDVFQGSIEASEGPA